MTESTITMYGTQWCGDCHRSRGFLDRRGVAYTYIDVDQDPTARDYITKLNGGNRTVPTIVFQDGSFVAEPTDAELADKIAATS